MKRVFPKYGMEQMIIRAETVCDHAKCYAKGDNIEQDGLTIVFKSCPEPLYDANGNVIGVQAHVRAYRDENELKIDPHRVCINPPLVTRDGEQDPDKAFIEWLRDSINNYPNPEHWME